MISVGNILLIALGSAVLSAASHIHRHGEENESGQTAPFSKIMCIRHPCILPDELPETQKEMSHPHRMPQEEYNLYQGTDRLEKDNWQLRDAEKRINGYIQGKNHDITPNTHRMMDKNTGNGVSNRFRRSPSADESDKNSRISIDSTKTFGTQSHGGWQSSAKIEHDFWKSKDGNQRISGFAQHDRIDGGRFSGFRDNKAGIGYSRRFRRSPSPDESDKNSRISIDSTKTFGPQSHGGWQSSAKIEHDFWKSKDGNQRISGFAQHDRIDGGRFSGFRDNKAGIGYSRRFRRSPSPDESDKNSRISIDSTKTFGPQSHGGWQSSAKIEHDFWKSKDGNQRISGFAQHDRIDGGRFSGFRDNKAGIGYSRRFRRSPSPDESDKNSRISIDSTKTFGPQSHGGWQSSAKIEHDFWKSKDGNQRISGFAQHDRIDGGRFSGFRDNKAGIGYSRRFRRSPSPDESDKNSRISIDSTKTFGPQSHGGWQSSAKIERDFWKSKDGNQRISGFAQHDRIDGGRFSGFRDNKAGIGYSRRFRRSPSPDESDKNSRISIDSTKTFGPQSHGGWQSSAKIEHDFWKSKDGNQRISGFAQHDRIDGGRFSGFRDNKAGIGYSRRFRRSPSPDESDKNSRISIDSTKTFGPQSHGGWQSSAKIEHDFWKSKDGNQRISGFAQHDRIDGGRFSGFRDNKAGIGYSRRFRRSPSPDESDKNSRISIDSTKTFGPQSHGGWQSSAKIEHDFWKSKDGNQRISGFAQHDRIDGGRFSGFRDNKAGIGYSRRFRRSPSPDESDKNSRISIDSTKTFGPQSHGGWQSSAKIEHDFWKSKDGNQRISGIAQHDRIDGGRFSGFRDNKAGIGYSRRFRRSPSPDESDKNSRISIDSTKTFGPQSHGGWQSSAKIEHDFWKSKEGNQRISGFAQHDRIDGGRFSGFRDNKAGIGYSRRFRRSPSPNESDKNSRISIDSTKTFGPQSHGAWQSSAKIELDFWKSKDGNQRISGFAQHDRIDGGRFSGFRDNKAGIGYSRRFRRSPSPDESDKNSRISIDSTKTFGPQSHGGWQSSAKIEHDFWKSKDGNQRISGFAQHDRIDGGRFSGFRDNKAGIGYSRSF